LTVHPKKIYLQPLEHGVVFLGAQMKPHRMYARSRTLGKMRSAIREADHRLLEHGEAIPDVKLLCDLRSLLNSYFGHTSAFKTHTVRKELWEACKGFQRYFSCSAGYRKVKIKKGYGSIDAYYREHPDEMPPATDDLFPPDMPFPDMDAFDAVPYTALPQL
jgi:hypothetical protein